MEKILLSLIAAILISVTTYVSKLQKGEKFAPIKLLRTILVGLSIGFSSTVLDIPPATGPENTIILGAASAGLTALGDQGVKIIINFVKKYLNKKLN